MTKLTVAEQQISCDKAESVLDALLREHVDIPFGCKSGVCQACMIRSLDTTPPDSAQQGLKDTLKKLNYFLACCCYPEQDMTLQLTDQSAFYREGFVVTHNMLNTNTLLLRVSFQDAFEFNAGQFVSLQRAEDGLSRSYSIANLPDNSNILEFHIRRVPNGTFSVWLHEKIGLGDSLQVSEPRGHCFYIPERSKQSLLLVGTGTGLAPLEGIILDALKHGHSGNIHLFHGSRYAEDLYHIEEMRQLAAEHRNFFYTPCVSGENVPAGFSQGRADQVALAAFADLKNFRVFLCGHPEMVNQMKMQSFLKGASMNDIYTDAFVSATR
jgi:NAD(P)H-flavin reductase/ferredoxin